MLPCHHTRLRVCPARSEAATSNFEIATAERKFNCELRLGCVEGGAKGSVIAGQGEEEKRETVTSPGKFCANIQRKCHCTLSKGARKSNFNMAKIAFGNAN